MIRLPEVQWGRDRLDATADTTVAEERVNHKHSRLRQEWLRETSTKGRI